MSARVVVALAALAAAASAYAALPVVQPGKWVLKSKANGQSQETTLCGNPLDKVAEAIAAAHEREKSGCRVTVREPVPRTTSVRVECPDREKSELTVNSASMQSVTIDMWRAGRHETVDAERVGACEN
ncbi:MAG TPA: hypothetical protein VEH51_14645 [Burkholderiales bacterium]|nr:hypothetical protein [Burkholderiales bacterium]